mmetsp:Transcript_20092/g.56985  ORF Transcript_20092/g.56985 Transcript_20092/m.56985 type:complete len:84 (-) Transcript_20092:79-330(-)
MYYIVGIHESKKILFKQRQRVVAVGVVPFCLIDLPLSYHTGGGVALDTLDPSDGKQRSICHLQNDAETNCEKERASRATTLML